MIRAAWGRVLCLFNYHDPISIGSGLWVCAECWEPLR